MDPRGSPECLNCVSEALEVAGVLFHAFLVLLHVQKQHLECLHKVKNLMLVAVKSNTDPLYLADQIVEQLLPLHAIPIVAYF